MILDAVGRENVGKEETTMLRIRGASFFWNSDTVFISSGKEGLRIHGSRFADSNLSKDPPLVLLPFKLEKGKTWQSASFEVSASVLGLQDVEVPSGSYKAWSIEYVLTSQTTSEHDIRAWFVPNIGFVRIEWWQENIKGTKKLLDKPRIFELARFESERRVRTIVEPRLSSDDLVKAERLIGCLGDERVEAREKTVAELVAIGRGVVPIILERAGKAKDSEIRGRLQEVIHRFPKVEFVIRALKANGKVGEPLPVGFALRNIFSDKIQILPTLSGSTSRYPRYVIEVVDGKGQIQKPKPTSGLGLGNPLNKRDFVTLESGEETDPFGPGSFGHPMVEWVPEHPGTYTLVAVYDATGDIPDAWVGSERRMDAEVQRLLETMPRGRIVSNRLTIVVEP
jgi:hypothetical protein